VAHVRKDTLTAPPEYWKHLKWHKRTVSKAERKAAKKQIKDEYGESLILKVLPILKAKEDYERARNG